MNTEALANLWAKTRKDGGTEWHPLILHLLDVAACADAILAREPETTRAAMAAALGLPWCDARPWLMLLVACHDLGKASPGFQFKWPERLPATGLPVRGKPDTDVNHAFVSQAALAALLRDRAWPPELADRVADAMGCHHGSRATPTKLEQAESRRVMGGAEWDEARRRLVDLVCGVFKPVASPSKPELTGPEFMLLAGLTSFADWIGSNEDWFLFGQPADCEDLHAWFEQRRAKADEALDAIGWAERTPLAPAPKGFDEVFGFSPRPLQRALADVLPHVNAPSVLLVEAPMGEGKTEAAFFAHLALQRRFGHRGMYVALPTKATGNAMFGRTLKFLRAQGASRPLDLQLLHGAALLNDSFQKLRFSGISDEQAGGEVRAGEWFTHKKRALLSEYGVGTVDQALMPILPVRHNFVRLWGLANRVVIFDEIHAYDAYTGTLLVHLLRWIVALGTSVVLLSATLSPGIRRKLADAVSGELPVAEADYPRLTLFSPGAPARQYHFESDPERRVRVRLRRVSADLVAIRAALDERLSGGGTALALVNTVQRAQDLYRFFPEGEVLERDGCPVGKRLPDGTELLLLHARFPADERQVREEEVLHRFGRTVSRTGRQILIATQVAEQSLDLDFDVMVTDLAPIDLVLQRAGRLWRHARGSRPVPEPVLLVAGLAEDEPLSFGKPLWWSSVYREDVLLRTWSSLRLKQEIVLPNEIDRLVQDVYEERVSVPESLRERLEKAMLEGDGEDLAHANLAHRAIIGFPDDASWKDPELFVLYDEDEPGIHRDLMAKTRLGEESIVAIPLGPDEVFDAAASPSFEQAKEWYRRAVSLARVGVVKKLKATGIPEGWKTSPLLRSVYPLMLTEDGRWLVDKTVRLDNALGVVYEAKEKE